MLYAIALDHVAVNVLLPVDPVGILFPGVQPRNVYPGLVGSFNVIVGLSTVYVDGLSTLFVPPFSTYVMS
jgi:hypothetical protein